ncbi:uncharacterized protein LOC126695969 [Quercus robur]|uniref:uncharacterized protein LOC126695969 n=1 Tax=Quercus robur TaxID=38942 RepID=UPI0021635D4A|nr:uncharacterized protein LOC126695969 [Quercus robur]
MSSPNADKVLFAYIAATSHAVSLVLIREDNGTQRPVYYVSKSLQEAETQYLPLEKAILAVVQATRKLPHYFQAHTVVVLTQLPLKSVLRSADYTGRIAKWGTILGAFDIRYMPRTAIKGQVIANLVAKFAEPTLEGMEMSGSPSADGKLISTVSQHEHNWWKAHIDGAANQRGSGVWLVLVSPEGITIEKSLRLGFSATNNEAEYEAVLEGMSGNTHADSLTTLATSSAQPLPRVILVEDLCCPTTEEANGSRVHNVGAGPNWMDPLVLFLKRDTLPNDKVEANKSGGKLLGSGCPRTPNFTDDHSRGHTCYVCTQRLQNSSWKSYMKGSVEAIRGVGPCGSHRAMTLGYWWPSMHKKALEYVKKCDQCQRFAPNIHQPGEELNPLSSPWPFAQWGLDILGPFPKAAGNKKFLLVSTDYFTKRVEAEALGNIRDVDVKKFVWKNIITRFGTPHTLILDNGLQFDSKVFREYCNELGIINRYSTPAYPQGNGQERWVEELAHVLWTYRTTPRRSTGETPFSLTYGAEAVIPLEINFPTQRTTTFDPIANNRLLEKSLDLLEEKRESAMVHLAYYQQKLKQGYDSKVKSRPLAPGDLVLRKVMGTARNPAWGKLGPN